MKLFIGADLGTSALKLLLVQEDGRILKTVSKAYPVSYPHPGWSEQNPQDWWEALTTGVAELTEEVKKEQIKGIGVAGQMHGLVILEEAGSVIRPAILWNDGRTDKETEYLNVVVGEEKLAEYTDNIAFAGFTAPKLLWLRKNEPENFSRMAKIMLPKDYINYRLTGIHATDYSDAAGTLLLDVKNKCWSQEMLSVCGIREEQMPKLFESYEKIGTLTEEAAAALGLNAETIVVAGAGDNAAAAIGTGTVEDGKCNISLGTSGTIFISADKVPDISNHAIHTFCHANGGYHLLGCMLSAASCNKWWCEDILKTADYTAEQEKITDAMLGNNDVYFLPYLMGERSPVNDTDARGTLVGMRLDTKREEMMQAVLEGVAFAIRDSLEVARDSGIVITKSTLCGGGAKSPLWQKILANVLNVTIEIPAAEEGPGMGAAVLAMAGGGVFADVNTAVRQFRAIKAQVTPVPEIAARYQERYDKFKRIYPSLKEVFKKLREVE